MNSHEHPHIRETAAGGRSPLWAVLMLTFLGSIGTGVFTNGIFFLTTHTYGFSVTQNYVLGLVLGLTYSVAALGAGPLQQWLAHRKLATRTVLGWVQVVMVLACLLPLASQAAGSEQQWPVWVLVVVYSPLTGLQWPLAESFLSGGRSGIRLRSAVGKFNIVWSSALVVGMWGLGPLIGDAATAFALLASVHLLVLPLLMWIGAEPGQHVEEEHERQPLVYRQLLVVFRILLPTSYVVSTALVPFLPAALTRLEISSHWQAPLAATWMAARFFTFLLLERWHGWHGRWYPALAGVAFMLGGFALAVLAPQFPNDLGILAMLAGLASFGIGMATIYAGALYYAMEVGKAEVAAGGTHEALIGAGYTIGPLCGLVAVGLVASNTIEPDYFDASMLTIVAIIAVSALLIALALSWRARRNGRPEYPNIN